MTDVIDTVTYELTAKLSKDDVADLNPPIKQLMKAQPAMGDPGYPERSRLHGLPLNQFNLVTEALGIPGRCTAPGIGGLAGAPG